MPRAAPGGAALHRGAVTIYLSLLVLLPLAAVVARAAGGGLGTIWRAVSSPQAVAARIVLPNLAPAILAGVGLAFARCMGEFGSVVLISGNIPRKTEVASVFIFGQIESDNVVGAAAVSLVLLLVSFLLLLAVGAA